MQLYAMAVPATAIAPLNVTAISAACLPQTKMQMHYLGAERRWALLRQQRKSAIPIVGRRVFLIAEQARFIERVKIVKRPRLVGAPSAFDRGQRAFPIAAAITGQHFDGQVAQS